MTAPTYQDVVKANLPLGAWALSESSGTDFVPYLGPYHLTGGGTLLYQQAGPFGASLSLHLAVGAFLHTNSMPFPSSGGVLEAWFKLDVYPPTTTVALLYWGNSASNGNGLVVVSGGGLQAFAPGGSTVTPGINLGSGWHHVMFGNPSPSGGSAIALDGKVVYTKSTGVGGTAGNPDQVGFGSTSSSNAAAAISVAYPAVYNNYLTPQLAGAAFVASTDPTSALAYTLVGQGQSDQSILQQILDSVRKIF